MLQTNILVVVFSFLDLHNLLNCCIVCKRFLSIIRQTKWNLLIEVADLSRYMFFYINYKFEDISIKNIDTGLCLDSPFIKISHLIKDIFIDRSFEDYKELVTSTKDILFDTDKYVVFLPKSVRENIEAIRKLYREKILSYKGLRLGTMSKSELESCVYHWPVSRSIEGYSFDMNEVD